MKKETKVLNLIEKKKEKEDEEKKQSDEHNGYCPMCNHNDSITLYHMIKEVCLDALSESSLYLDDILSVLERTKLDLLQEHIELKIENRLEKSGIQLKDEEDE